VLLIDLALALLHVPFLTEERLEMGKNLIHCWGSVLFRFGGRDVEDVKGSGMWEGCPLLTGVGS